MTKIKEIYKCNVCGNITEVLHTGVGELVCCGQEMELKEEKHEEEGNEKHLPVIENVGDSDCKGAGVKVKIGEVEHPSEENHYIEWIEINTGSGKSGKKFLKPGDKPEAEFYTEDEIVSVREYCNIHGLWEKKIN